MKRILLVLFAVFSSLMIYSQFDYSQFNPLAVIDPNDDWHNFRYDSIDIERRAEDVFKKELYYYRDSRKGFYDNKRLYENLARKEAERFRKSRMDSLRKASGIMYTKGNGYTMPYEVYMMYLERGEIQPFE